MPEGLGGFVPKPQPQSFIEATVAGEVIIVGDGSVDAPLTDVQLRATPVPVSGVVTTSGLTNAELRATAVPISGTVTASGPLTDAQLRASAVPVSGAFFQGTQPVSGTFWQATQPVSVAALPLPTDASTAAKQPALGIAGTPSADVITVQGALIGTPQQTNASYRATYSAYALGVAFVSAGGTNSFAQLQGSATKTVRVTRISVSGTLTTAAVGDVLVFKTSTTASGGAPVTVTPGGGGISKHDSADATATAALTVWSTSPSSVGTTAGGVRAKKILASTPTTAPTVMDSDFGEATGRAIYLRGTSEYLQVYLNFASFTGASFNVNIEWTEE